MKFSSLGLAPEINRAIAQCGYTEMTPVQAQAIAPARRGKDLLVNAQTGTGKTAAFALPLLQRLTEKPKTTGPRQARALILTPTRELAEQLATIIGEYAAFLDHTITAVYGGVKSGGQANRLEKGVDVLIATPGRLIEHMENGHIGLAAVEMVVLDEVDRLLDMGFVDDVKKLLAKTHGHRQTLMFSATTTTAVNELAHQLLRNHTEIKVTKANTTAETVSHVAYPVTEARKIDLFLDLLAEHNWYQVLVFTSTKRQADHLLARLKESNVPSAICHGDKSQGTRRRALADFKSGDVQVLIATEVAARGLDIQGLDVVVNYNLPYLPEDYVHRIGRTGRAGASGMALSFVCREEEHTISRIERVIGGEIKRIYRKGYEVAEREPLRQAISEKQRTPKTSQAKKLKAQGKKKAKPKRKSISARAGGKKNFKAIKKNR